MADVTVRLIEQANGWRFEVLVSEADSATKHLVALSRQDFARLSGGRGDPSSLVYRSFEFLLEREPKESILRQFDLPIIGRYFPDYEAAIRQRL